MKSYLQIVLRKAQSSTGFVVNGWLIPDDEVKDLVQRYQPLDLDEEQKGVACKLEDVPKLIEQFVNLTLNRLCSEQRYSLTIEFFLPKEYLCTNIDSWQLTNSYFEDESYTVGTQYPVVIRSCERLEFRYLETYRNQWCDNWDRVKSCWHEIPNVCDFEHLSELENCNWKRVINNLTEKLGLKLTCGLVEAHKKELFKSILKASTPIAIWARCNYSHWNQVSEIDELLLEGPLLELSEIIRKKRITADCEDRPEEHLGYHLALLWEDPYRLTPDAMAQLVPPRQ
ncbi:hypothetical protein ACN4EG_26170 [Alkalinema pantanalense CENA528]|uniref:VMAP-C domain-containing protein n=1 Tax=Alkalinema pantanalense TaxID=1620705 RepID=UPI003D6E76CA